RPDLPRHRGEQLRGVALARARELCRLREREEQAAGLLSFLVGEQRVPRAHRETFWISHGGTRLDLDRHRELRDHPPDEEQLLRILLAEVRRARAGHVEESV